MSTPYPPQPRRLMRDPSHKLIGGVCSGLAKYLNMDVNLVRILTVLISLFTGIPIVLYVIALFVLPEERPEEQPPYVGGRQPEAQNYGSFGYQPAAAPTADPVWGSGGAPWEQPQSASAPTATSAAPAAPAAGDQTWSQSASEPDRSEQPETETTESEPTSYDTAPVEPAAEPAEPESASTEAAETSEPKRNG